jgi:hypothetical protein
MENLSIDNNMRNILGAVTNDGNEDIKRVRVNPITGAMIVEANIVSTNTSIGSTIPGGTAGSVLFLGLGSTLDEDNSYFFYDSTGHFLALGHNTPTATLDVVGSFKFSDGSEVNGYVLTTDGSGNATWAPSPSASSGYNLIQNEGVSVTQRTTVNLSNLLTATDSGAKTALTINVANLAADTTFTSSLDLSTIGGLLDLSTQVTGLLNATNIDQSSLDLNMIGGSLDLSTQVTGLLDAANIDVTSLEAVIDLSNLQGQLDLTTQVTGVLPLANGGTQTALSDPGDDTIYVWDDTDNATALATIGSGLSYDHATHTLSSIPSPINPSTQSIIFEDFMGGIAPRAGTTVVFYGQNNWTNYGATAITAIAGVLNHPGIIRLTGDVSGNSGGIGLGAVISGGNPSPVGFGPVNVPNVTIEYLVRLGNAGNTTQFGFGEGFDATGNTGKLGISSASNIWQGYFVKASGQAINTTSGTVATTTNWVKLKIVTDGTGANAEFFVDGVSLGTLALASGDDMTPICGIIGNGNIVDVDYFYLNNTLTR